MHFNLWSGHYFQNRTWNLKSKTMERQTKCSEKPASIIDGNITDRIQILTVSENWASRSLKLVECKLELKQHAFRVIQTRAIDRHLLLLLMHVTQEESSLTINLSADYWLSFFVGKWVAQNRLKNVQKLNLILKLNRGFFLQSFTWSSVTSLSFLTCSNSCSRALTRRCASVKA